MTLFIKNGKILNVDKNNKLDILISGDKISAIGNFYNKKSDEIIDAEGCFIASGFIDIYNELDHNSNIFSSDFNKIIKDGATDVFIGHSGASLAPVFYSDLYFLKYYSSYYGINFNWKNLSDFFNFINQRKLSFNLGTFVGFKTLKYIIAGESLRQLEKKEFIVFLELLKKSLNDGAFGLSLDWDSFLTGEISLKQLEEISKIIFQNSKILAVSLAYNQNEETINNLLNLVSKTKVKLLINNYLNNYLTPEINFNNLKKLESFYPNVFLSISPYTIDENLIYKFLPLRIRKNNITEILKIISDDWMIKRFLEEMPEIDPEKLFIFQTEINPRYKIFQNKSLKEIMEIYEINNPKLALLKIMRDTKLRDVVFYENVNLDVLVDNLISKNSLIGSGWFYLNKNVFSDLFSLVLENKLLSFDKLIKKITFEPAKFLGLKNYEIKIGSNANLVGFNIRDEELEIKFVIVNGKIAFLNKEFLNFNGKALKAI
jgi:N-acyl-D-aspartate/D-glutamate deacylase